MRVQKWPWPSSSLNLFKFLILKKDSKRQIIYFKVFILKYIHVESFTLMLKKKFIKFTNYIWLKGVQVYMFEDKKRANHNDKENFQISFYKPEFWTSLIHKLSYVLPLVVYGWVCM